MPELCGGVAQQAVRVTFWLFDRGHAADVILVFMALELAWLTLRAKWRFADAALLLAPGALMIAALRVALTGGQATAIALLLALSFPAHLADLRRRRGGTAVRSST